MQTRSTRFFLRSLAALCCLGLLWPAAAAASTGSSEPDPAAAPPEVSGEPSSQDASPSSATDTPSSASDAPGTPSSESSASDAPGTPSSESPAPPAATQPSGTQAAEVAPWDVQGDPFAEQAASRTVNATDGDSDSQSVQTVVRALASGGVRVLRNSLQNPGNAIVRLPRQFGKLELRPDLTARINDWTVRAKPRAELEGIRMGPGETDRAGRAYLLEWYARWALVPSLHLSVGNEYLQWGPSQLISPSNMFFLENARLNPLAEVPGSYFSRAVWVLSPEWTASAIVNFLKGERQESYREFERRYALKVDYSTSVLQLSTIASYGERSFLQFGAYAVWVPSDAWLLYVDGRVDTRRRVLYPELADNPFGFILRDSGGRFRTATNLVVGASYTSELNLTLAGEYLFQSDGYSAQQASDLRLMRENLVRSVFTGGDGALEAPGVLPYSFNPGLLFQRRHYAVAQARYQWADGNGTLALFWIANLNDRSSNLAANFDIAVSDHLALLGFGMLNLGPRDGEFRNLMNGQVVLGASYAF